MTVEIICVGTEILLGNIVNTNAAYLAGECAALGLSHFYQTVVGDNEQRLRETLEIAAKRSDIILLCGGLGPTEDDLTKETCAAFLGKSLLQDEKAKQHIADYFEKKGITPTQNNWKQADVIEGATVFYNENGTAPGMAVDDGKVKYVLLPGPPNELIPMFTDNVVDYLKKFTDSVICSQTVKICGVSESTVETRIKDLIDQQKNPTIATYAKTGEVHIRVTAKEKSSKEAQKLIKPLVKELKSRFGNDIYTTQESITLEGAVTELLLANHLSFSCAESCTGGMLSAKIIGVPGVSEVFNQGLITYSNKAKRKLLGVKKSTLQKYGAVSSQTAGEMVKGLAELYKTDVGVAITGIAGPGGGTKEKPVGLVYIACNVKGKILVEECHFNGNRDKVRESAVQYALMMSRRCILEYISKVTFGKK